MDWKKIVLVFLLLILFAAVVYQVTHLRDFQLKKGAGDEVEKNKTSVSNQIRLDDIQLPRIHLDKLEVKGISFEHIGRNLFTLHERDARKAALIEEKDWEENFEEEEYGDSEEEYEFTSVDSARLPEMRNVRFVGLAIIKGRKVAGIIVNGYVYLGMEGDVIANTYNIHKIEDKFVEISIAKSNKKQKIPLEGN